jgi:hypothetical protein
LEERATILEVLEVRATIQEAVAERATTLEVEMPEEKATILAEETLEETDTTPAGMGTGSPGTTHLHPLSLTEDSGHPTMDLGELPGTTHLGRHSLVEEDTGPPMMELVEPPGMML